jgi:hypothetical protein
MEDKSEELDTLLTLAIGEASQCWSEPPKGVFNEQHAIQIVNNLAYDLVKLLCPTEEPTQLKSYSQDSVVKHVTLRTQNNVTLENAIDWAIEKGLDLLSNKAGQTMHLVNTLVNFRPDGIVFVTVLASPHLP